MKKFEVLDESLSEEQLDRLKSLAADLVKGDKQEGCEGEVLVKDLSYGLARDFLLNQGGEAALELLVKQTIENLANQASEISSSMNDCNQKTWIKVYQKYGLDPDGSYRYNSKENTIYEMLSAVNPQKNEAGEDVKH